MSTPLSPNFLSLYIARALTEACIPYSGRRGCTVYFGGDDEIKVTATGLVVAGAPSPRALAVAERVYAEQRAADAREAEADRVGHIAYQDAVWDMGRARRTLPVSSART